MIARGTSDSTSTEPPADSVWRRWLGWWQQFLTGSLNAISRAARARTSEARAAITRGRDHVASGALKDLRGLSVVYAGSGAVLLGALAGVLVASPGMDRRVAALAGAASIMWAAIRWVGMRLAAPRLLTEDARGARGAFCAGLLVYAFAFTPELRLAAWLASGVATAAVLTRIGRQHGEVARSVGFPWGAQALVVVGGWLGRSALVAALAARG